MSATITVLQDRSVVPDGLVWENPPEKTNKPGKYAGLAAALKANPGKWAVVRTYTSGEGKRAWGFAGAIRSGKFADLRDGFESVARTIDGQVRVYVRYQPVSAVQS